MKLTSYNQFASEFRHDGIRAAAEHAARLGFEWVETLDFLPSGNRVPIYENDVDECRRILDALGLRVACASIALDRCDRSPEEILDAAYREIEFAARLGSPCFHHTLVLSLRPLADAPSYAQMLQAVLPNANRIAARCAEYGMQCLYEPQGMYFNGVNGVRGLLDAMREEYSNVGVCMDIGNSLFADEAPLDVVKAFAGDTVHVHVKDYLALPEAIEDRKGYFSRGGVWLSECALGEGACDLPACLAELRRGGYDGTVSLEINGDDGEILRAMEYLRSI